MTGMKVDRELKANWAKFKKDKRAYYSFLCLVLFFFLSLPTEFICNVRPLIMSVEGKWYFPVLIDYTEKDFGGTSNIEPDYKSQAFLNIVQGIEEPILQNGGFDLGDFEDEDTFSLGLDDFEDFEEDTTSVPATKEAKKKTSTSTEPKTYWILWPPIRYDYKYISTTSVSGREVLAAPYKTKSKVNDSIIPSSWVDGHYLGTDDRGRDVLARLLYGFRISMIFGVSLAISGTIIGCLLGGIQGFFGGWIDLIGQRFTELWGSMPRLFILIILSSFLSPSILILFLILNLTAWMGIAAYIRAEFLKVRNLEFVKAARSLGVSNFEIMRKHILPNSLTPVITFFPFEVTAGILALVSLDYLNLGVPSPAPSIGELLAQGKNNLHALWILLPTFFTLTITLTLLTFFGEGIRNAFDPRKAD